MMTFNRYQAFGTHLLGSVLIALCSAALVFLVWYPTPLEEAAGVTHIFLMLLAIDVVLGPVITLIIFNPAKKELKYDLAIVLLIQIAALLYGLNAVFQARPVYLVYSVDRFDLVFANDLTEDKLTKVSNDQFKSLPLGQPQIIAAQMPSDIKMRNDILFSAAAGGDDLQHFPQFYVPYGNKKKEVLLKLQAIEKLNMLNHEHTDKVAALIQKYANHTKGIGFLPLKGKVSDLAVIIDKENGDVLEITALKPW
jgi:hypothetical protein